MQQFNQVKFKVICNLLGSSAQIRLLQIRFGFLINQILSYYIDIKNELQRHTAVYSNKLKKLNKKDVCSTSPETCVITINNFKERFDVVFTQNGRHVENGR